MQQPQENQSHLTNWKDCSTYLKQEIGSKVEEVIKEDHFGFWKSKGTRDDVGLMSIISEKVLGVKEERCLCFIDLQKAFDHVDQNKLLEMLRNRSIGVNWKEY